MGRRTVSLPLLPPRHDVRIEVRITMEGRRMTQGTGHNARCTVLIPVIGIRYSVFCVLTVTVTVTVTGTGTGTGRRRGHAHSIQEPKLDQLNLNLFDVLMFGVQCSVFYVYQFSCAHAQVAVAVSMVDSRSIDGRWLDGRWSMVDFRFSILESRIAI